MFKEKKNKSYLAVTNKSVREKINKGDDAKLKRANTTGK